MPERPLRASVLPKDVRPALDRAIAPYHPHLIQGMLFGLGKAPGQKSQAGQKQVDNLNKFAENVVAAPNQPDLLLNAIIKRQADAGRALGTVVQRNMKVSSQLLVGIGLPNPLETGLLLHPLYGVPYLPGSALKGVTRAHLLQVLAGQAGIAALSLTEELSRAQQRQADQTPPQTPLAAFEELLFAAAVADEPAWAAWDNLLPRVETALRQQQYRRPDTGDRIDRLRTWHENGRDLGRAYCALFGTPPIRFVSASPSGRQDNPGRKGRVIYFDAFPTRLHARPAVLTPHAPPYYGDAQKLVAGQPVPNPNAPGDYHDPIPVPFVTIGTASGKQTVFAITIAAPDKTLADFAMAMTEAALKYHGIGAKSGSGFGLLQ